MANFGGCGVGQSDAAKIEVRTLHATIVRASLPSRCQWWGPIAKVVVDFAALAKNRCSSTLRQRQIISHQNGTPTPACDDDVRRNELNSESAIN